MTEPGSAAMERIEIPKTAFDDVFMTCNAVNGDYFVMLKFPTLKQAQAMHGAIIDAWRAALKSEEPTR